MERTSKILNWFTVHEVEILFVFLILFCITLSVAFMRYAYVVERKKNLALKSSLAKSFFIQKVGYELRNPLNGVIGFTDMLEAGYFGDLNVKQRERVQDIHECGMQLQNLVNDFLDLAKGEAGNIEIVETEVGLDELLEKVLDFQKTQIKNNDIKVVNHIEGKYLLKGDLTKFIQVFKNIIDNAIKFTSKGGQVTIKDDTLNKKDLVVEISDTGKGMSVEELDIVFLYPDRDGKMNGMNGIGLGLPLAKLFMDLHGGSIEVESEEGIGTTVILTFPAIRVKRV